VFAAWGWKGLAFAVGQAVVSIVMLETVNYLEHYGLQRRKGPDGRYERVGPQHSWNAAWMVTSSFSFRLQRHADHHLCGARPYQLLRDVSEAPQLPFSYPGAMLLAALPPLHFKVMHARLDAYEAARKQPNDMAMAAPAP
jgi:alkane 1-monooxygenase